jgi:hypothetical protein
MPSSVINSDDGVISGTSGLKSSGGDDGALAVQSNGTEVAKFKTTELVINDGGANYDFRVEGDTDANLLVVDASADAIGIGTSTPDAKLDIRGSNASVLLSDTGRTQYWRIQNIESTDSLDFNASDANVRMRLDSSGNLLFNSGYGSVATAYGCRAWVNFQGTGTVAIREDGNVSSITDNGTGQYTVNFTTAMPDANYSVVSTAERQSSSNVTGSTIEANQTTSTVQVKTIVQGSGYVDVGTACVSIFR